MLNGIIVNINSNRFKVLANDKEYICSARGKFRNDKITPLVGDNVLFNENTLQIEKILERKNFLLRPMIANVDIAVVITSTKEPDLDLNLLDKLLTVIHKNKIKPLICFTKTDLLNEEEKNNRYKVLDIKTRNLIKNKKMLFADQDAIFWSTTKKLLLPRIYNEQAKFNKKDTVICHFCKRLMFRPYPHTENYKQWNIEEVHKILKCFYFDEDLNEYLKLKAKFENKELERR